MTQMIDEKLAKALVSLRNAVEFMDKCKADITEALAVGAYSDAREWIDSASRDVVNASRDVTVDL